MDHGIDTQTVGQLSLRPGAAEPERGFLAKLGGHLRRGTLRDRLLERVGILPEHMKVRWRGARNERQAVRALVRWAELYLAGQPKEAWVLSVGDGSEFHRGLDRALKRRGLRSRSANLDALDLWTASRTKGLCGIVCGITDAAQLTRASRQVAAHPHLQAVPFEYAAGINREHRQFKQQDEYPDTYFVAPSLLDSPNPYEIYADSLKLFERKAGLRDYLDLYQMLKNVVRAGISGDIAEFGSYRGHSGYLMARTLRALDSGKQLFMFDTFDGFPTETFGLDLIWNKGHPVKFAKVRERFAEFPNVALVKGEFTETLESSGLGKVALAFIDCDSYRATRFLIDRLWSDMLQPGGWLVIEDYGHPALLGSRAAVHEELESRGYCLQFFSQFSGLLMVQKPLTVTAR